MRPGRRTIRARVRPAKMMARHGIDHDDLRRRPRPTAAFDHMAPGFQGFDDLVGRLRLDAQAIRIPLMMKTKRRHRGLWELVRRVGGRGRGEEGTPRAGELGAVRFDHVSMAVDDLDKQIEWQTRVLGMEALRRWQDDELGYKAAIMSIPGSDLEFEIMAPIREDSFVRKFIDERGQGMHHVCVDVESTEAAAAALHGPGASDGAASSGAKRIRYGASRYLVMAPGRQCN